MPRASRSPPPHRARSDREIRGRNNGPSHERDDGHKRRRFEDDEYRREERYPPRREYRESDRERERERDRERYTSGRDIDPRRGDRDRDRRADYSSRRSASPRRPRSSRPGDDQPRPSTSVSPPPVDKTKPNYAPSGLLAAETNTVKAIDGNSTVLKYNEPPEARKPALGWRLYVFKGTEQVGRYFFWLGGGKYTYWTYSELLHIHRQSAYLIGRDRLVADISIDHPSCSKQHAVIQCA